MDWTELNHDLLLLIAKKLKDISDFVRLRIVCKRWRSIAHLNDMAPQFPCNINYRNDSISFDIQFHQSFSKRVHTVPINNIPMKEEITSMHCSLSGILLFHTRNSLNPWLILDPLTGFQTFLPLEKDGTFIYPIYFGHGYRQKEKPVKNDIDVVFIFYVYNGLNNGLSGNCEIGLWRFNDMEWTRIARVPFSASKEDVTYCNNGRLCVVSQETGHARVIDIDTGKITVIRDCGPSTKSMYIIDTGRDMLCLFNNFKEKFEFQVYLLEDFDMNPRLRKLKSIGNRVIFVKNFSHALCLNATDCEGYRSNCIYFDNRHRYEIENNRMERTLISDHFRNNWFVPSLY